MTGPAACLRKQLNHAPSAILSPTTKNEKPYGRVSLDPIALNSPNPEARRSLQPGNRALTTHRHGGRTGGIVDVSCATTLRFDKRLASGRV